MNDFAGQIVLITGAARGFGLGATKRLMEAGAKVVMNDREENSLEAACEQAGFSTQQVALHAGDVADPKTHEALVALAADRFGGLDIAINNAGIGQTQVRLEGIDAAEVERVIAVDLLGVIHAMRAQLPVMAAAHRKDGRQRTILNVASVAGVMAAPTLAVYAAAKHGVVGLTRSTAIEYGRRGVRVNALCPAFTRTNMVMDSLNMAPDGVEEATKRLTENNPMQRLGEVDEIVQAMLWAVSPQNSFYNGQTVVVDGGLSAF